MVVTHLGHRFAGYVNAANFMDGVDSISVLHGVVSGVYFYVVGDLSGRPFLQVIGLVCSAVFVGFAPWNLVASFECSWAMWGATC